jgi:hypothetical protein
MNFGVGGYNIVSEIEVLKEYGLKYTPDIVVLNYFYNDNEKYSFNYHFFLNKPNVPAIEKDLVYQYYRRSNYFRLKRLLLRSHLYVFVWTNLHNAGPDYDTFISTYEEDIILEKLLELRDLAEKNNFRILICLHPILDYDINEPHQNYRSTINAAETLGLTYVDLHSFYRRESPDPNIFLLNGRDNVHINSRGHGLVAKALFERLESENFISF